MPPQHAVETMSPAGDFTGRADAAAWRERAPSSLRAPLPVDAVIPPPVLYLDFTTELSPPQPARLPSQLYCGKGTLIGISQDEQAATIIPILCKSWDCPTCAPRKRAAWITRLAAGNPEREITLTRRSDRSLSPAAHALLMKKAWARLVLRIRRTFGPFEYALVWELQRNGTPHCHVLTRGRYIPRRWLKAQWIKLGQGSVVWITSVKDSRLHAAHVCKYLGKKTSETARVLAPLRIIQVSAHWDPPAPPAGPGPHPEPMTWVFTRQRLQDVMEELEIYHAGVRITDHGSHGVTLDLTRTTRRFALETDSDGGNPWLTLGYLD